MALYIECLAIDSPDPEGLARFWCAALDYEVLYSETHEDGEKEVLIGGQRRPRIAFYEVHDRKVVKNRLHFDFRPDDRDAEVERLLSLGATKVDIGQGEDVSWVVLADPEGNEFCILRALTPDEAAEREQEEAAGKW